MTSYFDTMILSESPAPTAYWRDNETSGTTALDSTTHGNNATRSSGVTFSQAGAISGDPDLAILFGSNDTFTLPASLDITSWSTFTLELWIKQTGLWNQIAVTASNLTGTTTLYLNGAIYTSGAGDTILIDNGMYMLSTPGSATLAKIALTQGILSASQVQHHFLVGQLLLSGGTALMANGTGTASYDSYRVVTYPDPSAPLTNAGRASNSVVNWNANLPANTGLTVYTSTDNGITFQQASAAGNTIPAISTLLYSTLILQRKPPGYWYLGESVSPSLDSSGNGYSGTWHGTITAGQAGALQGPGELSNTALLFDGSTGYISVASGFKTDGWSNFAVSCWFYPTASPGSGVRLLANDDPNSTHNGIDLGVNASLAGCFFRVGNGTTSAIASFGTSLSLNTWYHLVGVFDGVAGTLKLYLNSVLQSTVSLSGSVGTAANVLYIGQSPSISGRFFQGRINEVSFINPTTTNAVAPILAADVLAQYNAGLCQVGTVADDSFTADTHTAYTSTNGTGGSTATWTWDTANSRLIAVGGSKALLLYNNLGAFDNDLWVDLYQSENAGLVWGWRDASNYYEMIVKDSGASVSPNTLILNKISGGTTTLLSSASITFPVQTHHRFHVSMLNAVITISMDENQILTYTDSSPFPAGSSGLRNDTGTSYIYMLQVTPQAANLTATALCSKHVLTTTDATVTPQVTDHQAMASDSSFGVGAAVPTADYRNTYVSDNIDAENTRSNYWWQVGDTSVTFQPRNAVNAPYILQSSDILIGTLPTVEYSGDMYRNEQVLTGVFDTSIFTQLFVGDGQAKTWNVANPVQAVPTITLNGLVQSVGIQGTDTGKQFYYQNNSTAITQDNSGTTLTSADTLSVAYLGAFGIDFSLSNTGQISNTISQAQYAATDGTSGVVDAIEDVSQKNMNVSSATDYVNTLLQRYGSIARTIVFDTLHSGLKSGHSLTVFVPQLNIFDSVFLVVEVQTNARTITVNGSPQTQYVYHVTASEAAALSSWTKMFSRIMRSVTGTKAKA